MLQSLTDWFYTDTTWNQRPRLRQTGTSISCVVFVFFVNQFWGFFVDSGRLPAESVFHKSHSDVFAVQRPAMSVIYSTGWEQRKMSCSLICSLQSEASPMAARSQPTSFSLTFSLFRLLANLLIRLQHHNAIICSFWKRVMTSYWKKMPSIAHLNELRANIHTQLSRIEIRSNLHFLLLNFLKKKVLRICDRFW